MRLRAVLILAIAVGVYATPSGSGLPASATRLVVAQADTPEALLLTLSLLQQEGGPHIIAVVSNTSARYEPAAQLKAAGAEIRSDAGLTTLPPSHWAEVLFYGLGRDDWVFFLAPLSASRLAYETVLIDAAAESGVGNALLLSIIDGVPPSQVPSRNATAIGSYFAMEDLLAKKWRGNERHYAVLRTYFYQQNLVLWATDVVATSTLRLPIGADSGCFAPLFEMDVATAVASLVSNTGAAGTHRIGNSSGTIYNLTGPLAYTGNQLAAAAASATGNRKITFKAIDVAATKALLNASGSGLSPSEISLVVGLITLQTTGCSRFPSNDLQAITGHPGTPASVFFKENARLFGGGGTGGGGGQRTNTTRL